MLNSTKLPIDQLNSLFNRHEIYSVHNTNKLLVELLDYVNDYELVKPVSHLILGLTNFLASADPDDYFVSLRQSAWIDATYQSSIANMREEIEKAILLLEDKKLSNEEKQFLFSALVYCANAIDSNMNEFSRTDLYYQHYKNSKLKSLVEDYKTESIKA